MPEAPGLNLAMGIALAMKKWEESGWQSIAEMVEGSHLILISPPNV
jgi:hypothetical protein